MNGGVCESKSFHKEEEERTGETEFFTEIKWVPGMSKQRNLSVGVRKRWLRQEEHVGQVEVKA